MDERSTPQDPFIAPRLRSMQYVADGGIVFAGMAFAVFVGKGWAWGPFIVELAVVAAAMGLVPITFRIGIAVLKPTVEELDRVRARRRARNVIVVPAFLSLGVAWGLIAGSLRSYWPDAFLGVVLSAGTLLPLALLPRLRRRAMVRSASDPTDV